VKRICTCHQKIKRKICTIREGPKCLYAIRFFIIPASVVGLQKFNIPILLDQQIQHFIRANFAVLKRQRIAQLLQIEVTVLVPIERIERRKRSPKNFLSKLLANYDEPVAFLLNIANYICIS
jgi:hypothetical protein